jgi:Putative Ig domain
MRLHGSRTRCVALIVLGFAALIGCKETEDTTVSEPDPGTQPNGSPANSPPRISGSPAPQVVVGNNYSFTPTASDADGDSMTFSIDNKPSWAQFNAANGRLSGTASAGTEGVYPDIRISVSDSSASASLPRFAIEVTQSALGVVTLSWTPPQENEDGSPLTDLKSYTIYYGQESRTYTGNIGVANPGVTTYVVENLAPDTYYFAITASNDAGMESSYSSEVVYNVN